LKYSCIKSIVFIFWWLCCSFQVTAQYDISVKEATILANQVYDSLKNKKYSTLAHAMALRIRYLDLVHRSDIAIEKKLKAYLNGGHDFYFINLPSESIRSYNLFFEEYEKRKTEFSDEAQENLLKERMFAYSVMARSYAKFKKLDSAAMYQKMAISITQPTRTVSYPSALNNYGLFLYEHRKDRDSAVFYFKKAFALVASDFPDDPLLGSIRDNVADIYLEEGAFEKARDYYQQNFYFFKNDTTEDGFINDVSRFVSAGIQLIETNLKLNNGETAESNFEILKQSISVNNLQPSMRIEFLTLKQHMFEINNQVDSAYVYSQKINVLSDSLNLIESKKHEDYTLTLNSIVSDRMKLAHKLEQNKKEAQISTQRLLYWITTLAAVIIITIIFLLYQRRNQRLINTENERIQTQQAFDLEKLKNTQLKSEVISKERDLSDFAINLSQNYQWAQELSQKLQQVTESTGRARAKLLIEFGEAIQNKIDYNHDTKDFFDRLDLLNDAFYKKLNDRFPNLSKTEKRLCSLIRLKLDSQQIATFQNITLASVNTARYRLRRKLKLTNDEDLDNFIVLL